VIESDEEQGRDLARLVVARAGRLVTTGDAREPYRVVGPDGAVVEPVSVFLRDLLASGKSELTLRSYSVDLLRWWRFLDAVGIGWDRASRAEARVILSPASGRGSDLRGCVEVTVLDAAAAVFRFFACRV
jgi:hypothetical protein